MLDRRSFLALAGATVFGAGLSSCGVRENVRDAGKQLNIYSWADYIHPDTIPEFEKRYGIRVMYDTFSSNEALLAKMQAGATQYDVIVPTSYMIAQLKKLSLLSEIDHSQIPLIGNVMERFRNPAFDPGLRYSVPYTWGTTGIGFSTAAFPNARDYPRDWDAFWDQKVANRITLLDDARESIGMVLKRDGHSYNTRETSEIEHAARELIAQKPLVMCYTSDQVIVQLAAGDSWLALGYSGDIYQAISDNPSVHYVIPASGTSLWLDNLCIPASAPHKENAYKWINYLLEPEVAAANAAHTKYATPNQKALPLIDSKQRIDVNLYPPETLLSKCDELGDIGNLIFVYDRLWTELKCS